MVRGPDGAAGRTRGRVGGGEAVRRSKRRQLRPQLIHGLLIRSKSDGVRRLSVHQRLGLRVPSNSRRRLSAPDAEGWQKVLAHEPPVGCTGPRIALTCLEQRWTPRRILEAPGRCPTTMALFRGRCFRCLARDHKVAYCRHPLRCFRCGCNGHMLKHCPARRSHDSRR
jgi:hypothetical protein